ncbi:MAG: M43 family zinc metalloprotease, partial [Bacteroidota bacterium]
MKNRKITFLLAICLAIYVLTGQNKLSCGFNSYIEEQFKKNPKLKLKSDQLNLNIANSLDNNNHYNSSKINSTEQIFVIPTVFHILHAGGPENIPDSMVYRAMNFLNESLNNEGYYDSTSGEKINIQVCLAQQDPLGNPHSGIDRVYNPTYVPFNFYQDYQMKLNTHWNTKYYLNIYCVQAILFYPSGSVFGYSSFPSAHGNPDDGFVLQADIVGTNEITNSILTHELGHYLGLYHTFEGGCNNSNCLLDGDRVCDTPPDNYTSYTDSCTQITNSCNSDTADLSLNNPFRPVSLGGLGDQNDLIKNYMDYSSIACYQDFTQGQKNRMRNVVENVRYSLLNTVSCKIPCNGGINGLILSANQSEAGIPITASANYDTTRNHYWLIDDQLFSTASSIQYTFTDTGYHTISICISDTCGICKTDSIYITCSAVSSFTSTSNSSLPGGNISFNASNSVFDSLTWIIGSNNTTTTSPILNFAFLQQGTYQVQLISYLGTCFNSSHQIISVRRCAGKNRANNWIFGNKSGMTFTENGIINTNSPINPPWGTACISNEQGGLLFFTDGYRYYNRYQNEMPSSPMLYSPGGIQTALALKRPGNNSLYDVPTLLNGGAITFGTVDMSLDSGNGDISDDADSIYLFTNSTFHSVDHCNGKHKWIVTHKNNTSEYWSFLQNENGIQNAVISNSGSINNSTFPYTNLKLSPDGSKLAMTFGNENYFEISDFNNETGQVSGTIKIPLPNTNGTSLEFSSDSKVLYVGLYSGGILQFNTSTMDSTGISNSGFLLPGNYAFGPAAMQMGPDYKIYVTKSTSTLDRIENPNGLGSSCNFQPNAIPVTVQSYSGLPGFHSSYFDPIDLNQFKITSSQDTICNGENVQLMLNSPFCEDSITWTVIGSATLSSITDSSAILTPNISGMIHVIANRNGICDEWADTIGIFVNNCLDINQNNHSSNFIVYPNPSSSEIHIEYKNFSDNENYNLSIQNCLGQN